MIYALIKGLAMGLMLSISVGPIVFAVIRQALVSGHKGGLTFVFGVSASDITVVLICNVFTQIFQSAMSHEKLIGIIGSFFLIILGVYSIFFKKPMSSCELNTVPDTPSKKNMLSIFFSGYFMNILNPGVFLFWFAASATLMDSSKNFPNPEEYRWIAFITCLAFVLAFDILKVFLAGKIREKLTPHNINVINRISGIIIVLFGVLLLVASIMGKRLYH